MFRGAERRKAQDIRRVGQELRKPAVEVVVSGDVIENRVLRHEWRQIATPAEWQRLRKPEVRALEVDGELVDHDSRQCGRQLQEILDSNYSLAHLSRH